MKRILKINQRIDSSPLIYFKNSLFFILVLAIFLTWNKTGFHYKNRNIMWRCFCIYIFCLNIPIIYIDKEELFFFVWEGFGINCCTSNIEITPSLPQTNSCYIFIVHAGIYVCVVNKLVFLLIFVLQLFAFFQEC